MKKLLSLVLALAMLLTVTAGLMASASAENDTFHIGIVTGSVSQSEDDRRGAEAFQAKYGEDRVSLAIYPDNFTEELETTIQTIVNLSADPDMKAIIVNQAVPGTAEAFRLIKERRPDIFPQKAYRPRHSVMSLDKAESTGFEIVNWREALNAFLMRLD